MKSSAVLPVLERFSDGSYRSELVIEDEKRRKQAVLSIRVVVYEIDDPGRPQAEETTYRLITTILEPSRAPASELAGLHPGRWGHRDPPRRAEDPRTRPEGGAALEEPSESASGDLRLPVHPLRDPRAHERGRRPRWHRPRACELHALCSRSAPKCPCRDRHDRTRDRSGTVRSGRRDRPRAPSRAATASRSTSREAQDEQVRRKAGRSSQLAPPDQARRGRHPRPGGTITKRYWT